MTSERKDAQARDLQVRTNQHYDAHPFDFLTPAEEVNITAAQPRAFQTFVETYARRGKRVAEVGCGPGRGTMFLAERGLDVVAVDISQHSLELARNRAPTGLFVRATNLDLPFADEEFDLVVSDGVIHHTPNARRAFAENARILARGGALYVGVYNPRSYYRFLYQVVGLPVRRLNEGRLGRAIINLTLFPIYYFAHLLKSRGRRTLRGARNLFYDYLITPRASFHGREEIAVWGTEEGMELTGYDPSPGNVHVFIFRKNMNGLDFEMKPD